MIILRGGRHPPLSLPCVFSVDGPSIFIQIFQIFHFKETLKISDLIKKRKNIRYTLYNTHYFALLLLLLLLEEEEEVIVLSSNNGGVGRNPQRVDEHHHHRH